MPLISIDTVYLKCRKPCPIVFGWRDGGPLLNCSTPTLYLDRGTHIPCSCITATEYGAYTNSLNWVLFTFIKMSSEIRTQRWKSFEFKVVTCQVIRLHFHLYRVLVTKQCRVMRTLKWLDVYISVGKLFGDIFNIFWVMRLLGYSRCLFWQWFFSEVRWWPFGMIFSFVFFKMSYLRL